MFAWRSRRDATTRRGGDITRDATTWRYAFEPNGSEMETKWERNGNQRSLRFIEIHNLSCKFVVSRLHWCSSFATHQGQGESLADATTRREVAGSKNTFHHTTHVCYTQDTYTADVASVFKRCEAKIRDSNLFEATLFTDVHGKSALML
eukprot:s1706_g5.t1